MAFLATLVSGPIGWAAGSAMFGGPEAYAKRTEAFGKGLVDSDEWKTHPFRAATQVILNVGTLAVPGADGAGAAADVAKGADFGKLATTLNITKDAFATLNTMTDPLHWLDFANGMKFPELVGTGSKEAPTLENAMKDWDHEPAPVREPVTVGGGHDPSAGGGGHDPSTGGGGHEPGTGGGGHDPAPGATGHDPAAGTGGSGVPKATHVDHHVDVTGKDVPGPRTPFAARTDLAPNTAYHVEGRGTFYTDSAGHVTHVETNFGKTGSLNPDLIHPRPNTTYVINHDQVFHRRSRTDRPRSHRPPEAGSRGPLPFHPATHRRPGGPVTTVDT